MIKTISIDNFNAISNEINVDFTADMRTTKFSSNVATIGDTSLVKSMAIYGSNNTGKSTVIQAISTFKKLLLGKSVSYLPYLFSSPVRNITNWKIEFIYDNILYSYCFKYNIKENTIEYEKFQNITNKICIFMKDTKKNQYKSCISDKNFLLAMEFSSKNKTVFHSIDIQKFNEFEKYKNIIVNFSNKIEIIDTQDIPIENTIKHLKENSILKEMIINLIKKADLQIEDYKYSSELIKNFHIEINEESNNIDNENIEEVLKSKQDLPEIFKLITVYHGQELPSILFDSTGTKKFAALASYIVEALTNNKILIVDEIESSLHFILTRAIVALFNNELNKKAQLLFTTHDAMLLDLKKMFRKDQIAFIHKDNNTIYFYKLSSFKDKDGIRSDTDILNLYNKGKLHAIPTPEIYDILETIQEVNYDSFNRKN